jgi:hypothetical protein
MPDQTQEQLLGEVSRTSLNLAAVVGTLSQSIGALNESVKIVAEKLDDLIRRLDTPA